MDEVTSAAPVGDRQSPLASRERKTCHYSEQLRSYYFRSIQTRAALSRYSSPCYRSATNRETPIGRTHGACMIASLALPTYLRTSTCKHVCETSTYVHIVRSRVIVERKRRDRDRPL